MFSPIFIAVRSLVVRRPYRDDLVAADSNRAHVDDATRREYGDLGGPVAPGPSASAVAPFHGQARPLHAAMRGRETRTSGWG